VIGVKNRKGIIWATVREHNKKARISTAVWIALIRTSTIIFDNLLFLLGEVSASRMEKIVVIF